jgi:hypothetical protein
MNIYALEVGNRPRVMTKSRRFAPVGTAHLAELLGQLEFADEGNVVLDWSNVMGEQPEDAYVPVVYINVMKRVDGRILTVKVRLDVEDTFGRDEMMADDFFTIAQSMEKKMNEYIEQSRRD